MSIRTSSSVALVVLGLIDLPALAQITVNGVSDRTVYANSATLTVQTNTGYDYAAWLDTNAVPAGVPLTVSTVDYHELLVWQTNQATRAATNTLVRFIVRSSERGTSENGIPPWTPLPTVPSAAAEFTGAQLLIVAPETFPAGLEIPVLAWVLDSNGHALRASGSLAAPGQVPVKVRRGAGAGLLAATNPPGTFIYAPTLGGLAANKSITLESNVVWTGLSGALSGTTIWPAGARIAVTNTLTIPAGSVLTIGEGAVVILSPKVEVAIEGELVVNGTVDRPVVFIPAGRTQPWGGFLLEKNTSRLTATGTLFTGSGAVTNWFGSNGRPSSHRKEEALFYCTNAPTIMLTDCGAFDLAGQLSHSVNGGTFRYTRFLLQRCTSGGEHTGAKFVVNDSALIECPVESATFVDGDNDALYLVDGTHGFTNTLFGWTKDDGVDSGGDGSGVITYQDCWFESTFHEGNSLSGTGKNVTHSRTVFHNCGQGLEAGYNGPSGTLAGCLAAGNLVGGRFGDNYDWTYTGFLRATNSLLLYNYRDVWGMNWQDWSYRSNAMDIRSNWLTAANARHPSNEVWQAAAAAARLAGYQNTPPGADVGAGLALWMEKFTLAAITNAIPVRLSSFTTNAVVVNFAVETSSQTLASGTLSYAPGETLKWIPGQATGWTGESLVRVRLTSAEHAVPTGITQAWFSASTPLGPPVPTGSVWHFLDNGVDQGTAWRSNTFSDTNWKSGPAQLGFGDGDERTLVSSNRQATTYFRSTFNVADPAAFLSLMVRLQRDDGGIVYLNGAEIFRNNITNGIVTYSTLAYNATDESSFFSTNVPVSLLQAGTNLLAAEIHQSSLTSSDLSFDLALEGVQRPLLEQLRFGSDWLLYWTDPTATLETAEALPGTWTPIPGSGPVVMDLAGPQRFYRLRR